MPKSKFSTFQLLITAFFGLCIVAGVAAFAVFGGSRGSRDVGRVVIWGTVEDHVMSEILTEMTGSDSSFQTVTYVHKDPATYNADLLQAIASGKSPELLMLSDDQAVSFADKILPIPYSTVSQRSFDDSFIDEAALFERGDGLTGMPIVIDPLVMYYNRDIFAAAGVPSFPKTWTDVQTIVPKMTSLDAKSDVKRSAVALGSYDNVAHAKEILAALFFQVGENIVQKDSAGAYASVFGSIEQGAIENPAESVVRFYTGFTNPVQSVYSWNRALPNSLNAFVAGDLGMYFGRASEYKTILTRNPNLNFGVAPMPQTDNTKTRVTYGRMYMLAVPRGSENVFGGTTIAVKLAGQQGAGLFASKLGLPPVRRDLLADVPEDSVQSVFADSALISRSWYDPNPTLTESIFKRMIESTVSGQINLNDAVHNGAADFQNLFDTLNQSQ